MTTSRSWDDIQAAIEARRAPKPALTFTGIPLAYWREEVRRGCAVALARLARICEERGCDWEKTLEGLQ